MKHFSSKNPFFDHTTSDEEFDELVSELLHVEPPPSLIDNIISSVAKLSPAQQEEELLDIEDIRGRLIAHYRLELPS